MRVLVTGGAGFIGSHVVDQLQRRGHAIHVFDNLSTGCLANLSPKTCCQIGDICDVGALRAAFEQWRPDAICHLAGRASVSGSVLAPSADAQTNILGLLALLELAVQFGTRRIVAASSGGVLYGDVAVPAVETADCDPVSPYGISKWAGERYLGFFAREHQIEAVALRYGNVYGPRQKGGRTGCLVAAACSRMMKGQPAVIYGSGENVRDFVHVEDVARATVLALETRPLKGFNELNVGTGQGMPIREVVSLLHAFCEQALGAAVPGPVYEPPRAGDLSSNILSSLKARELLGWRPAIDLESGLRQTVAWYAAPSGPVATSNPDSRVMAWGSAAEARFSS